MIKFERNEKINFFKEPTDSVIISMLEGRKGNIWTDEEKTQVFAFDGIFGYFDGNVTKDFVEEALREAISLRTMDKITFIPQNNRVEEILAYVLKEHNNLEYVVNSRYQMTEPKDGFDCLLLKKYISLLPDNMKIELINEDYFKLMKKDNNLEYLTESYRDYNEFEENGIGFIITKNGIVVSGAVSYSVYSKGIEVQYMTVPEYRGRGLATVITARLLLHCAENNLRAIWDAANRTSVSVANKMGYILKREYNSYTIM